MDTSHFARRAELIPLSKVLNFRLWEERLFTPTSGDLQIQSPSLEELKTTLQFWPSPHSIIPVQRATSQRVKAPHRLKITSDPYGNENSKVAEKIFPLKAILLLGGGPPESAASNIQPFLVVIYFFSMILNPQPTIAGHCCQGTKVSQYSRSHSLLKSWIILLSMMTEIEVHPTPPPI